ncbi:hypothetical protein N7468_002020 [Penicillium chermesinum]|uniref:DNA-directed RNA polymerase RBP11-like dimerisation domain-containing protein n=1 Tax=Penicillium chermesinum TaxID=63820 RepID=A0A9W9PJ41_9EURO|nr:uncharacterized protein N7468_002020 [Penicillium chermesinum]KAJ5247037.1 hypothetical protein N7468_002020 [Penicillium chermesinum]KAJ6145285.1 hypothetical protein N7470_009180 [Penicillium chermesinum]
MASPSSSSGQRVMASESIHAMTPDEAAAFARRGLGTGSRRPQRMMTREEAVARHRAGRRGYRYQRDGPNRSVDDRPDLFDPTPPSLHRNDSHQSVGRFSPHSIPNTENRYESILLGPDKNKIDVEIDTRIPNAAIFTFHKEDHTLGNMLRSRLLKTKHVVFAAYRVPHPLTPNFLLRVQTDGEITPRKAVITASQALIKDLAILAREFQKEYELRKMANAANQQQNVE